MTVPGPCIIEEHEQIKDGLQSCPMFACHGIPTLESTEGLNRYIWVAYACSGCGIRTPISEGAKEAGSWWNDIAGLMNPIARKAKTEAAAARRGSDAGN